MQTTFRNEAYGEFGHRQAHASLQAHLKPALVIAVFTFLLGAQLTTQWVASRLAYQPSLGAPAIGRVYAPWKAWLWRAGLQRSARGAEFAESIGAAYQMAALLALVAAGLFVSGRQRRSLNRIGQSHGSARWAEKSDIERAGLLADTGVIFGAWEDPKDHARYTLRHHGPDHILFFATTGAGKGLGCVLPTLLTWQGSAIVLDLKGENFALTSGYRKSLGHHVLRMDLSDEPQNTAHYNLLDWIRFGTHQEEGDIRRLATARVDPTGALKKAHSDGSHWLSTGAGFLAAAILHSAYKRGVSADGRCAASLATVLADLSDPSKTFDQLMQEWLTYPHDPKLDRNWSDHDQRPTSTHQIVASVARIQLGRSPNERSSIMSTVVTALEVFRDPLIATNTSLSDFSVEDLMDADVPTTLYLSIPQEDADVLAPVLRLFLDLMMRRLCPRMKFENGREKGTHKHEMLLLLDELPTLGSVPFLSNSIGHIRGWGVKALIIVQNLKQLREHFGQFESISPMCGVNAAYAPAKVDTETSEQLSKMCGTTTVVRRTPGRAVLNASTSDPGAEHEQARALLTPDEVSTLPGPRLEGRTVVDGGDMLAFARGCPAIYAKQFLFFQDPVLLQRSKMPSAPPVPEAWLRSRQAHEARLATAAQGSGRDGAKRAALHLVGKTAAAEAASEQRVASVLAAARTPALMAVPNDEQPYYEDNPDEQDC